MERSKRVVLHELRNLVKAVRSGKVTEFTVTWNPEVTLVAVKEIPQPETQK